MVLLGGLIGSMTSSARVSNSNSDGIVTGDENVGGIIGYHQGELINSYAKGKVKGVNNVGGFVGYSRGNISFSFFKGSVEGEETLVGL